jgi:hypothetical protein
MDGRKTLTIPAVAKSTPGIDFFLGQNFALAAQRAAPSSVRDERSNHFKRFGNSPNESGD